MMLRLKFRIRVGVWIRVEGGRKGVGRTVDTSHFVSISNYMLINDVVLLIISQHISDVAKFKGTVKLGDSYRVNQWLVQQQDYHSMTTMMADKCVPVAQVRTVGKKGKYQVN